MNIDYDYIKQQLVEYGTDPFFNKKKFINITLNEGLDNAIEYACNIHFKRCEILIKLAQTTYKEYDFTFTMDHDSKPPIYIAIAKIDSNKAQCIHITYCSEKCKIVDYELLNHKDDCSIYKFIDNNQLEGTITKPKMNK